MPRNLLIGGCSSSDLCEKVVGMNRSASHSYLWKSSCGGFEAFLYIQGNHFVRAESNQYLIVVLGHLSDKAGDVGEAALRKIENDLPHNIHILARDLEGTFSLIAIEKSTGKITIYRTICGVPNIYYTSTRQRALFSDSLSYLVWILSDLLDEEMLLDCSQLPYNFLYTRYFCRTLFSGIRSVMPGEQVCVDRGNESHLQLLDIGDMTRSRPSNCREALEHTMRQIMTEYVETYPDIVNIFSGGVDSSYIQAHLSQLVDHTIRTFSMAVLYPSRTWQNEYHYALSGSRFFGSDHTFVKLRPEEYPDLLLQSIRELGRPPTSQGPLTVKLWESVKKTSTTALMGVAGDTLFGMTQELGYIDRAVVFEKFIPSKYVRTILPRIVESFSHDNGWQERLGRFLKPSASALRLDLHDTLSPMHPFNLTEPVLLETTRKLLGYHGVAQAIHERQSQMKCYGIQGSLKECLHALLLLNVGLPDADEFCELASHVGLRLVFPFLDSRMIKTALSMRDARFPYGTSKKITKSALRLYLPRRLVCRKKTGWGSPVREWMRPGGVLYPLLEKAKVNAFVGKEIRVGTKPNAFDWLMLCLDIWRRFFLEKHVELCH
jgi:asparagine synthetase B (glutamine-hydrolysing)